MNARSMRSRWGLLILGIWMSCGVSFAQVRRYRPSTPTVSPYNALTRLNGGALPNYFSIVRPQLDQRAFNLQEQTLRRGQSQTLLRLQNDIQRGLLPAAATGTGSSFLNPGTRSSFLDTSRFYPRVTTGRRLR